MTRSRLMLILALAVGGCHGSEPIGSNTHKVAVVDSYGRAFSFAQPSPCAVTLAERVTDEDARVVEYDGSVGGSALSIVYRVDASSPLPLSATVYLAGDGGDSEAFTVAADDHTLQVSSGGSVGLQVQGYDGSAPAATGNGPAAGPALSLLACALPARTSLGAVPAFLLNRSDGRESGDPGIGSTSSGAAPILPAWSGSTTLMGTFLLAAACVQPDGWRCPCLDAWASDDATDARVVGPLPTYGCAP